MARCSYLMLAECLRDSTHCNSSNRLAGKHEPGLYLEPKWLRCLYWMLVYSVWDSSMAAEKDEPELYLEPAWIWCSYSVLVGCLLDSSHCNFCNGPAWKHEPEMYLEPKWLQRSWLMLVDCLGGLEFL